MRQAIIVVIYLLGIFIVKERDINAIEQGGYFEVVSVPVKTQRTSSIWAGPDATGTKESVYLFTQHDTGPQLWLLRVDPDTGVCEPFYSWVPGQRPRATNIRLSEDDGWLYGDWDTMRYRFSPKTGELQNLHAMGLVYNFKTGRVEKKSKKEEIDLAEPKPDELNILGKGTAPDGKEYTYRGRKNTLWMHYKGEEFAHLWVYDPKTGEEKDLGKIPSQRQWWHSGPGISFDRKRYDKNGKVYFNIAIAEPAVIVYDPKSGEEKDILPEKYKKMPAWSIPANDSEGNLYYFFYSQKTGEEPRVAFRVDDETMVEIPVNGFPGYTGDGYPYDTYVPSCQLRDGRTVSLISVPGAAGENSLDRVFRIYDPKTGTDRNIHYDYSGQGVTLFGQMAKGTDGKIYSCSEAPLILWRYNPATGRTEELGHPNASNAQAYSLLWHDGKLFLNAYGQGLFSVYDPTKPWRFGKDKDANPIDLGTQGGPGGYRFFDMTLGPDKKIYAVSCPANGYRGGSLLQIDPKTYATRYWWNKVVFDHGLTSITADPDGKGLWIGSGPWTHSSAGDYAETEPKLALWDTRDEKTVFECEPYPGMIAIRTLFTAPNGLIYGLGGLGSFAKVNVPYVYWGTETGLFVFDPKKREVIHRAKLDGAQGEQSGVLSLGPDGMIYGVIGDPGSKTYIYSINPEDHSVKILGYYPRIRGGTIVDGKNVYFTADSELVRYVLP